MMTVAASARVALDFGASVVVVTPLITPSATAQAKGTRAYSSMEAASENLSRLAETVTS